MWKGAGALWRGGAGRGRLSDWEFRDRELRLGEEVEVERGLVTGRVWRRWDKMSSYFKTVYGGDSCTD